MHNDVNGYKIDSQPITRAECVVSIGIVKTIMFFRTGSFIGQNLARTSRGEVSDRRKVLCTLTHSPCDKSTLDEKCVWAFFIKNDKLHFNPHISIQKFIFNFSIFIHKSSYTSFHFSLALSLSISLHIIKQDHERKGSSVKGVRDII